MGLTCGKVDVSKQNDVCGDEGDELSNADLLLEMDVDHVIVPQATVGRRVEMFQTGPETVQEATETTNTQKKKLLF